MLEKDQVHSDSISILPPTDERWIAFLTRVPLTNIFHHPAWSQLLAECYGFYPFVCAVCDSNGEIIAGMPVMEIRSWLTGLRWVSLPFSDHCRPLFQNAESLYRLTDYFVHLSSTNKIPRIELRWEFPSRSTIQSYSHHVLHTINLCQGKDEVANHIQAKYRRLFKVAEQKGVYIEWGNTYEHLSTFYQLELLTRRRLGVPIQPKKFFDLLWENLIKHDLGFILLAYKDDQCLSAAIFLHWQKTLTYKYASSSGVDRNLSPNDPLLWKAICWGCDNGYSLFDLGRTENSNTGLRFFKKRWGSEEVPLVYSSLGTKPPQNSESKLMLLSKSIIRNSPLWVCRSAGELLYRYFG